MNPAQADFQQLRIKHILFKSKVRSALYGGTVDEAFFSRMGPISTWFSTIGMNKYGDLPELHQLLQVQQDLTAVANQLFAMYKRGQIEQAIQGLEQVESYSEKFLGLLSRLEAAVV